MKKIVIIGPESTGKSTLCEQLARHYNTVWCPEFAREYLLTYGKNYNYDDLLTIAKGQIELEEKTIQSAIHSANSGTKSRIFIDTDMYVMKIWCEFVFEKCHRFILDQVIERKYDLYLLCNVDMPWIPDELREYPDLQTRQTLYKMYKDLMINQSTPWTEISGRNDERLQTAIQAVDSLLKE